MNSETRKEYADTRMRPHKMDRQFSGMAKIPEARAWMLRKFERAQVVADDDSESSETRKAAQDEAQHLAEKLRGLGVIDD